YLKEHGVEKTIAFIESIPNQSTELVASAAFVLLKAHEAKAALPALHYATKKYPSVASYQVWLGQALGLTGDQAGAVAAYRKAAELLPADRSSEDWRNLNKYLINKGMKELGASDPQPKKR